MSRHERRAAMRNTLRLLKGGQYGKGFQTSPHGRLLGGLVEWSQQTTRKLGLDDGATVAMLLRAAAIIGAQKTPVTEDEFAEAARVLFQQEARVPEDPKVG
jgi:hypothetical protein